MKKPRIRTVKQLHARLREEGFELQETGKGHLAIRKNGNLVGFCPSDHGHQSFRMIRNCLAQLKNRHGIELN